MDQINAARRHTEQRLDQAWALTAARVLRRRHQPPFDGEPRFAIVTVNASTTHYLKLMLLTLSEQDGLDLVLEIVVVDNGSRDGGVAFLRSLAQRVDRVRLLELHAFKNHARGMRAGTRAIATDANVVLFCDPDVVWRNPKTLLDLASSIRALDGAVAGEPRGANPKNPDIQASFLAVRRDVLERRDVRPPVNHGSPLLWLQADVVQAGLTVVQFPSNHGGYILHRGRTAVAATSEFTPHRSYATAATRFPHYMGVPNGDAIWAEIEARHASLLAPDAEPQLLRLLAERLGTVRT